MLREAKGGLKLTVGIVFCSFLFLSATVLFSLAGYVQMRIAHI